MVLVKLRYDSEGDAATLGDVPYPDLMHLFYDLSANGVYVVGYDTNYHLSHQWVLDAHEAYFEIVIHSDEDD